MKYSILTRRWIFRLSGCVMIAMILAGSAWSADFEERKLTEKRSAEVGLGRPQIELLARVSGRGREAVAEAVLQRFAAADTAMTAHPAWRRETTNDRLEIAGEDWVLTISGDGTSVSYHNEGLHLSKQEHARPVAERLSQGELERLGRRFIAERLEGLIEVGPGEEIFPLYTEFEISGGGSTEEGAVPEPEEVVASAVVFSRTIDGIPIVGAGSKIGVVFANDGVPVGFDFDWPQYRLSGTQQRVLPLDAILERTAKLASLPLGSPEVTISRFDCGYYDPGIRHRDPEAPVQAACFVQALQTTIVDPEVHRRDPASGHLRAGVAEMIPAGVTVEPDRHWPQALAVAEVRER